MFLEKNLTRIELAYKKRKGLFKYYDTIDEKIGTLDEKSQILIKYLYSYMPVSDAVNYDFETFLDYVRHSLFLLENYDYVKELPDEIFLEYVLFHRVNDEEIRCCRRIFYDDLNSFLGDEKGLDRVLRANFWCAKEITYQSSDERTLSAIAIYNRGRGRCGEESTFFVQALRSIGIPSRQVYVPRWSHCDDNHAWVEVYNDGKWYFLGAAEPQSIINSGWFNNAASRAMLVHSRCFGFSLSSDDIIGQDNEVKLLNQLSRYAENNLIKVKVFDGNYKPVKYAVVTFSVINYSHFAPVAKVLTDENGDAFITLGLGCVKISAHIDNLVSEAIINTEKLSDVYIVLDKGLDSLYNIDESVFFAPADSPVNSNRADREYKKGAALELGRLSQIREDKINSFKNSDLYRFCLEYSDSRCAKLLLDVLSEKDLTDVTFDVLKEQIEYAGSYFNPKEEDIFAKYILNPRISNEVLRPYRSFILDFFDNMQTAEFKKDPQLVWKWVNENVSNDDTLSNQLYLLPASALRIKRANLRDKKILVVAILRTVGVAARLNPVQGFVEYYKNGSFNPIESLDFGNLIIESDSEHSSSYLQGYSITRINDSYDDELIDISGINFEENMLKVRLLTGTYRFLTSTRTACGDQVFYQRILDVNKDADTREKFDYHKLTEDEIMVKFDLPVIYFRDVFTDNDISSDELLKSGRNIYFYLEETKEPTEHILNEISERYDKYKDIQSRIVFIVRSEKALHDENISNILECLPEIKVLIDDGFSSLETVGRRMYADHEKLPFVFLIDKEHNGIFATAGYNVGSADMILTVTKL